MSDFFLRFSFRRCHIFLSFDIFLSAASRQLGRRRRASAQLRFDAPSVLHMVPRLIFADDAAAD